MLSINKNTAITARYLITCLFIIILISCVKKNKIEGDINRLSIDTNAAHTDTSNIIVDTNKIDVGNDIRIDKKFISELRTKSTDTLVLESNSFVLDAFLWRDFMPESPPNGKPLISINWLINIDSIAIPDNIELIQQYIVYNDSIWISAYEDEAGAPSLPDYKIEKISRKGPKWGPRIFVDVISQIYDSNTNKSYFLIIKNVYIERTD